MPSSAIHMRHGLPAMFGDGSHMKPPKFDFTVVDLGGEQESPLYEVIVDLTETQPGNTGHMLAIAGTGGPTLKQKFAAGVSRLTLEAFADRSPVDGVGIYVWSLDANDKPGIASTYRFLPDDDLGAPVQDTAPDISVTGGTVVEGATIVGTAGTYSNALNVESRIKWWDDGDVLQAERDISPFVIPAGRTDWDIKFVDVVLHMDGVTTTEYESATTLTVVAGSPSAGPDALVAADWEAVMESEVVNGQTIQHTVVYIIKNLTVRAALEHAVWDGSGNDARLLAGQPQEIWNRCEKDADFANNGMLRQRLVGGGVPPWLSRTSEVGKTFPFTLRWSDNSPGDYNSAIFSGNSDTKNFEIPEYGAGGSGQVIDAEVIKFDATNAAENNAGQIASSHEQLILGYDISLTEPEPFIVAGQDVAGDPWVFMDGIWHSVRGAGLGTVSMISLAIDPANRNHLLGLQPSYYNREGGGVYRSKDLGVNWEKIFDIDALGQQIGMRDICHRKLAFAPGNRSGGYSNKAACVTDSSGTRGPGGKGSPKLLSLSSHAGQMTELRTLPEGTFGTSITGCKFDPSDDNILYVWGDEGLFRFNDFPSNPNDVDGPLGPGSMQNSILGDLYISADGQTLILGRNGVYKSTNGASSFSRIDSPQWDADGVWVSHADPNYMMAYQRPNNGVQARYSHNGGVTWTAVTTRSVTGGTGTELNGSTTFFVPDPNNRNNWWGFSKAGWWKSTNAGAHYDQDNQFYTGRHGKNFGCGSIHAFDRSDPKKWVEGFLDVGTGETTDGGVTTIFRNPAQYLRGLSALAGKSPSEVWGSTNGIIRWSDGTFCAFPHRDSSQRVARWNGSAWTDAVTSTATRWGCGIDAGDENYAYQYRHRTSNKGQSWPSMNMPNSNCVIIGVSWSVYHNGSENVSIIYAHDMDGPATGVWKSVNRGTSWTKVYTSPHSLRMGTGSRYTVFTVDPMDPHKVYVMGQLSNGRSMVRELDTTSGTAVVREIDFYGGATPPADLRVTAYTVSAQTPGFHVARVNRPDIGEALYRSFDAGLTWHDLSQIAVPFQTNNYHGMILHPLTDNLIIHTTKGRHVMKRPVESAVSASVIDLYTNVIELKAGLRASHIPLPEAA